jgi:hypothetical protein
MAREPDAPREPLPEMTVRLKQAGDPYPEMLRTFLGDDEAPVEAEDQ